MNKVIQATVTQKGQITIPKEFRDALGIEKYGKVSISCIDKALRISPTTDFLELGGTLNKYAKKNKGVDPLKARKYMESHYKRV
ncbi:AbrB/MazE/SpoVT family DNA-binding domain-containing protein [bacterium]|nr:AbrB/MazE/SpoVT family DNA-binding domain-containing protein [bacterium]